MRHDLSEQYYVIRYIRDGKKIYECGHSSRVPKLYLLRSVKAACGKGGEIIPVKITEFNNIIEDGAKNSG